MRTLFNKGGFIIMFDEVNVLHALKWVLVCLFIGIIVGFVFFVNNSNKTYEQQTAQITTEDYKYYYNGEQIDGSNIDLHLYCYTVNNEEKKVYLTDRVDSSSDIVPIFFLR